ncbi:MAPEG family protein [Pelagibacterium sp.]|uniref:MAPEG family protein n=1 Tax=Pelagibacterium sp. TaxID=1967288 RepID=UPI003BAA0A47
MTFELWMVVGSVVLLFAQITIQALLLTAQLGREYNAGPRDEDKPLTGRAGRAKRMVENYLETYPAFIALALAAVISGGSDWLTQGGAALYVVGRIVYIPLYLQGIAYFRSMVWILAALGLVAMTIGLIV